MGCLRIHSEGARTGLRLRVVKKNNECIRKYDELNECNQFLSGLNGRGASYNLEYYFARIFVLREGVVGYEA